MARIQINDADFYYELHGSGQSVILIAGYTCNHQVWLPILHALTQSFRVLIFDNRGVGETRDAGVPLSATLMASDVMALADALGLHRPHVIGHSMGGTIAQQLASEYPDRINKLVLLASVAKWRQAMLMALNVHLTMREQNFPVDALIESVAAWIFGEAFLTHSENMSLFKRLWLEEAHPQSLADQKRQYRFLQNFDGMDRLKHIAAPTLIVRGQQDVIALPSEMETLARGILHAQLAELNCGHSFMLEAPLLTVRTIMDFLVA